MTGGIDLSGLGPAPVAVFGLARSGLAAVKALCASAVPVKAWDDGPKARAAAAEMGATVEDLATADLAGVRILMLSPGIPHSFPAPHPIVARAQEAGLEIVCDIELLYRACPTARFIGITGTNGKSTTTALIGHVLEAAGRRVAIGGNIGIPALSLPPFGADGIYVLEMSSYQLELIDRLAFDVAILLNITPDHLDRHGGMDGYVAAKERIFARQGAGQVAVVGVDGPRERAVADAIARRGVSRLVRISVEDSVPGGLYVENGWLIDDQDGARRAVIDLAGLPRLPGRHNWQNALAAYAAARACGLDLDAIRAGFESFPGLVHRQQLIRTIGRIAFVDDSKATNADAASKALGCYDRIYWIAGGRAKEGGLAGLESFMPRVAHAFLIGEAAADFAAWLDGKAPSTIVGTLDRAVEEACRMATADGAGGVVLLSPAASSFDQFADFEERGRHFAGLVRAIAPTEADGGETLP